ncbi:MULTISPECIES: histidine phosphatase family protein [Acetobacteraceae]|uniref:Alpha-ribazole-5'-phosphate phosphatase n=2 Tax=Parasaccharibacter apium TaxID=1510841 RepID=A0A7U7J0D6_9PROT|nr:histidine phosphatase family protein [Parasaccharibacter apium]CDG33425.1 Alpha-ribazole-5'-phosphate phosphatase [Parasaccharibacter apium]
MTQPAMPDPQEHFLDGPDLPAGVTRFWLVRHAIVEEAARQTMYGTLDVPLCPQHLRSQKPAYEALARRLPRKATWFSSPLQRARDTGLTIQKAGNFSTPMRIDPAFIEQSIGQWNGTPHDTFPSLLRKPAPPFWSIAADERPPEGESMVDVRQRIGLALESHARQNAGKDMVILSHGGAIRMALAHCLDIPVETALRFCIQNLSLSIIEHIAGHWRIVAINELPAFHEPAE